ncbi:MAG: hypothetical protein WDZ62_00795 [Candidatus Pacearchaeota archaeon]
MIGEKKNISLKEKKGQVTIFIIIAILLVAGILTYIFLRDSSQISEIPEEFQPAYLAFQTCLESSILTGTDILKTQGGYIYLPDFEPGSPHMPFSSNLNFAGNQIPYWYYVSGNNLPREQVPSKTDMEEHLEEFLESKIENCNFDSYYEQGFEISWSDPSSKVTIEDDFIGVDLEMNLDINNGGRSVLVRNHEINVNSNLGNLYDIALEVYEEEQETLFLEDYGMDVLWNYAPVDGTEISCSPQVWNADEIFDELQDAIEANTLALNSEQSVHDYFIVDFSGREEVRFLNSKDWPHSFEVTPSEGNFMIANPLGNQPGLGVLGFCYTPYHFVYSMKYPVLVQVYEGEEFFQFPLAIVIEKNNPRESLDASAFSQTSPEICQYKNSQVEVNVRDRDGNPIDAFISSECFGERCNIGTTESGVLLDSFPQCANGFITARAEGFKEESVLFSTVSQGSLTIVMDKTYEIPIILSLDGEVYNGNAIIHFTSEDISRSVVYPDQDTVSLAEGQYDIQVYVYEDSEIFFSETVAEQCTTILRPGLLGIIGLQEEKCFEIEVPEQSITQAISGGGQQDYFILESELLRGIIEIDAESFSIPSSLEEVQINNILVETSELKINFR